MRFPAKITSSCIWVAIPVDWVILHWYACGADGRSLGWSVGRCTVTWLPNFLGWVDYFSFLPMVLRWRASRARAPLIYDQAHVLAVLRRREFTLHCGLAKDYCFSLGFRFKIRKSSFNKCETNRHKLFFSYSPRHSQHPGTFYVKLRTWSVRGNWTSCAILHST